MACTKQAEVSRVRVRGHFMHKHSNHSTLPTPLKKEIPGQAGNDKQNDFIYSL